MKHNNEMKASLEHLNIASCMAYMGIVKDYAPELLELARTSPFSLLDLEPLYRACVKKYGKNGLAECKRLLELNFNTEQLLLLV